MRSIAVADLHERTLGHFDFEDQSLVLVLGFAVAFGDALAFLPGEAAVCCEEAG